MNHNKETTDSISNNESQDQKDRDRRMRFKYKSCNKYEHLKLNQIWKKQLANYMINDLKNYGPANVMYIEALSTIINKPIQIWISGHVDRTINNNREDKESTQNAVKIEYHKDQHWTLLGNRNPTTVEFDLNSCLFTVIAAQTNRKTSELRTSTIEFLTKNTNYLIDEIDKLSSQDNGKISLMSGGARYNGRCPNDAAHILDRSQNTLCHQCRAYGHPRGHASDIHATGPSDSVENYSRTTRSMKSGFLSKDDQNKVAHSVLSHKIAQNAMQILNNGAFSQAITFLNRELGIDLPKMKEFLDGEAFTGKMDIIRVTVVLRHHQGESKNPNADVFVHTLYPRSS